MLRVSILCLYVPICLAGLSIEKDRPFNVDTERTCVEQLMSANDKINDLQGKLESLQGRQEDQDEEEEDSGADKYIEVKPIGLWYLNSTSRGHDATGRGHHATTIRNVKFLSGPPHLGGAADFTRAADLDSNGYAPGRKVFRNRYDTRVKMAQYSMLKIPNIDRGLTVTKGFSFFTWLYARGKVGPLFEYDDGRTWRLHVWVWPDPSSLFLHVPGGKMMGVRGIIVKNEWAFVGVTHDGRATKFWKNGRLIESAEKYRNARNPDLRLTSAKLRRATDTDAVYVGKRVHKEVQEKSLDGRLACMQVYGLALNAYQVKRAQKLCEN